MSAYQLPPYAWPTAVAGVCLVSAWRGRSEARLACGTLLLGWALSLTVVRPHADAVQLGVLAVDTAMLGPFLWIALRTRRFWPLFVVAFQLLCVATHVARALDPGLSTWAYMSGGILWSYLVAGAIGYGAWTTDRAVVDV